MKFSQAATVLVASAAAVGAFVPSTHHQRGLMATQASSRVVASPLAMSDSAVMDAETVEEGAETFE